MSANELQPNSTDFSDDYKEVDYNHEDYESIKNYMQSQGGECSVKNIKKVIEQTLFGAPLQVRLKK